MEEQKPDLEIVPKKPTYTKFETAYGKLRNAEQDLYYQHYYYGKNPEFKEEPRDPEVHYQPYTYDDKPFKEIQANMKKEFPFKTKKGNDKYTSLSDEKVAKEFPKSEYGIRYKAICDNLADQDVANQIGNKKLLKSGFTEERNKPYKVSDVAWDNRVGNASENLMALKGPTIMDAKSGSHELYTNDKLPLWSNSTVEQTVNTPLSKYYKYVNDDDHWVNPNVVDLDKEGNK